MYFNVEFGGGCLLNGMGLEVEGGKRGGWRPRKLSSPGPREWCNADEILVASSSELGLTLKLYESNSSLRVCSKGTLTKGGRDPMKTPALCY